MMPLFSKKKTLCKWELWNISLKKFTSEEEIENNIIMDPAESSKEKKDFLDYIILEIVEPKI